MTLSSIFFDEAGKRGREAQMLGAGARVRKPYIMKKIGVAHLG
jgi:hypothetical protein